MTEQAAPLSVHWDDVKILTAAGTNPETVFNLMERHGQTVTDSAGRTAPTPDAIYQWKSRQYIPDHWRAALVYCLLSEKKITLADLFRIGSGKRKSRRKRGDSASE